MFPKPQYRYTGYQLLVNVYFGTRSTLVTPAYKNDCVAIADQLEKADSRSNTTDALLAHGVHLLRNPEVVQPAHMAQSKKDHIFESIDMDDVDGISVYHRRVMQSEALSMLRTREKRYPSPFFTLTPGHIEKCDQLEALDVYIALLMKLDSDTVEIRACDRENPKWEEMR
jgi:hypothetical protein